MDFNRNIFKLYINKEDIPSTAQELTITNDTGYENIKTLYYPVIPTISSGNTSSGFRLNSPMVSMQLTSSTNGYLYINDLPSTRDFYSSSCSTISNPWHFNSQPFHFYIGNLHNIYDDSHLWNPGDDDPLGIFYLDRDDSSYLHYHPLCYTGFYADSSDGDKIYYHDSSLNNYLITKITGRNDDLLGYVKILFKESSDNTLLAFKVRKYSWSDTVAPIYYEA